jgi:hypothetical protein
VVGLGERSFYRSNRGLLAAMLGVVIFVATAGLFTSAATNPVGPTRFKINSTSSSNLRFWIVTWETYRGKLWIGQPAELDRKTFDLVTGCRESSDVRPAPEWTIKSAWDQRVVIQSEAMLVNPPPSECSSTTGGRVFSLGEFAIGPGRYQFELKFSNEISESISFPAELNIQCCVKRAETQLGSLVLMFGFFLFPILFFVFAFLLLVLLIRAGIFFYALHSK